MANSVLASRGASPPTLSERQRSPFENDKITDRLDWFAVETQPRREGLANDQLKFQGFVTLWPRFRKTRRHARRQDTVLASLFPGYIFVQSSGSMHDFRPIRGTYGVRGVLTGAGGLPVAMPAPIMGDILSRSQDGVMSSLLGKFPAGSTAQILSGPFANRLVVIERLDAAGRVRVLFEILGGQTSLAISPSNLAPASMP